MRTSTAHTGRRPAVLIGGASLALALVGCWPGAGAAAAAAPSGEGGTAAGGAGGTEAGGSYPAAIAQATLLADRDRVAGEYLDRQGRRVVAVTDDAVARAVRARGATPRRVEHSAAELDRVRQRLAVQSVAGTAVATDPVANQVVVSYDETVDGAPLRELQSAVAALGDRARLEKLPGKLAPRISGGDPIYDGGGRCSLGFNVRGADGGDYLLTAGHCGEGLVSWYADPDATELIGPMIAKSFPGDDYGLVEYDGSAVPAEGTVAEQDITSVGMPVVGETVTRRGSTSGTHSGVVTAVDATVVYPSGEVHGLIQTTVCAEPGDSGGPLYAGEVAYGITSGGSGDCTRGGTMYFQPVLEPMLEFGLTIK